MKYFLLTSDVETTSLVNHKLSDETGNLVANTAIPVSLELYAKYNIKSTFFITGYYASKYPESVKMIYNAGHEVACHGYSHKHSEAFDQMNLEEQIEHLNKARNIIEDIISDQVISFRAPALRTNRFTIEALKRSGFKIDSSIASGRFDFFLSLGSLKKINWLFAPRSYYFTSNERLYRKGDSGILEIPVTANLIPYIGTIMRISPFIAKMVRYTVLGREHINFLIHPIELVNEERDSDKIERRSSNPIKYLLSDVIRHKLKIKNIGEPGIKLLEKQLEYFKNKGYSFITCKKYLEIIHERTTT